MNVCKLHDPPPTCFKYPGNVTFLTQLVILRVLSAELSIAFPVGRHQVGALCILHLGKTAQLPYHTFRNSRRLLVGEAAVARAERLPAHAP